MLDLCRASLKTTLCDVGSLLKDLIYYYYYLAEIHAKYLTIIPWARVGYEMIDSQRGA